MDTKASENMEKQPSAPMSEHPLDENSLENINNEDRATPSSDQRTVKSSTPDNETMPRVTIFPVKQHSIGSLEPVMSRSKEVLKRASIGHVDKSASEDLRSPRRRRFVLSLSSRTKPPEIPQEYVNAVLVSLVSLILNKFFRSNVNTLRTSASVSFSRL